MGTHWGVLAVLDAIITVVGGRTVHFHAAKLTVVNGLKLAEVTLGGGGGELAPVIHYCTLSRGRGRGRDWRVSFI